MRELFQRPYIKKYQTVMLVVVFVLSFITTGMIGTEPVYGATELKPGEVRDISKLSINTTLRIVKPGNYTLKGKSTHTYLEIACTGVNLYLEDGLDINCSWVSNYGSRCSPIEILDPEQEGTVRIISKKNAKIYLEGYMAPGIRKGGTKTELIFETEDPNNPGTITAVPGEGGHAAIGSVLTTQWAESAIIGRITINSGRIIAKAKGKGNGAGIGGGRHGSVQNIRINGGYVEAYGGGDGAGIGAGSLGVAYGIIINGGTVRAENDTGKGGAAIGGGGGHSGGESGSNNGRDIVINGGNVTAISHGPGAAIGGGKNSGVLNLSINGGTVTAINKYDRSVAIGPGYGNGLEYDIRISGGIIRATGGANAPAIGASNPMVTKVRNKGTIRISGGTIIANGQYGSANAWDIAGADNQQVVITGGSVIAKIQNGAVNDKDQIVNRKSISFNELPTSPKYKVKSLDFSGEAYTYGMNSVYTIEGKIYPWLPSYDVESSVRKAYLEYPATSSYDGYWYGNIPFAQSGGTLYQATKVRLDPGPSVQGDAGLAYTTIGSDRLTDVAYPPVASAAGLGLTGYAAEGGQDLILTSLDGQFSPNISGFTDANGQWIKEGKNATLVMQWGPSHYVVKFLKNAPRGHHDSQISGTMEDQNMTYDKATMLRRNQYSLPGYAFFGWIWKPLSGPDRYLYDGQLVKSLSPIDNACVQLKAEWKPKTYEITLKSDDSEDPAHQTTVTMTYDNAGTLPSIAELGWTNGNKTFHGWRVDGQTGDFYDDSADVFNLCRLDTETGDPKGYTLIADWVNNDAITISTTENGKGISVLGSGGQFHLIEMGGSVEYDLDMRESPAGTYSMNFGDIPPGKYQLTMDSDYYVIPEDKQIIEYKEGESVSVILNYYTIDMTSSDGISSAYVSESGGTTQPVSITHVPEGSKINIGASVKEGYHFTGYSVHGISPAGFKADDPDAMIQGGLVVKGEAHIFANAEPNAYTIHFDANSGSGISGEMEDQSMVYDQPQELFANQFKKTGARFTGWNTQADGKGISYRDGEPINLPIEQGGEITLYAQWELEVYEIEYDLYGGELPAGKSNPATYTAEDSFTLNNPEKYGYEFEGWFGTDITTPVKTVSVTEGSTGNRYYTAYWNLIQYHVVFDTDGGSEVESQFLTVDQKVTKPEDPTREGYTFAGWYADKDRTEAYDFSRIVTGDMIIYAKWEPRSYELTYVDPFGKCASEAHTYQYDEEFSLIGADDDNWKISGYTLIGWEKTALGSFYEPGSKVSNLCTVNEDGTLNGATMYASWASEGDILMNIVKDDAGVTGIAADIKLTSENGTVYEGYFEEDAVLEGRYAFYTSNGKELAAGKYTVSIEGLPLPAECGMFNYDPAQHQILDYDFFTVTVLSDDHVTATLNGGYDPLVVLKGQSVAISAETETGYTFGSWTWLGDDGEPAWESGKDETCEEQTITVSKTLELTAHAEAKVYTVVFDANDDAYPNTEAASGYMENQDMVFGEPQELLANGYDKIGYLFDGWNTKPDGSGDAYEDGQRVQDLCSETGDKLTLYAQWKPRTYKITYKDPLGLCETYEQTATYNDPIDLLAADASGWTPAGHTLVGWEGDGLGSLYEPGKEVINFCQINEDGSLTGEELNAVWANNGSIMVSVTLDDEGVDIDPDDIQLTDSSGTTFRRCFVKSDTASGIYMFNMRTGETPSGGGLIPDGKYTVKVLNSKSYGLADVEKSITYKGDQETAFWAYLASDTVKVEADFNVSSAVLIDPETGDEVQETVVAEGTKVEIKAAVEEGYHFDGWSWLGIEGKPEDIEPDVAEQKITVDRTLVLAAHAKGNVYSVIFDANDDAYPNTEPAVGHMEHQDMVYGEPQQLYPNWYEKTGYEFDGWNTKPDGSGDAYTDKQSVQDMTPDAGVEITLYAQWKAREYTITFKDPYGMCQTEEKTVKYNDPVDLIDVGASGWQPVGHTLRGWESDAPGSSYEPGQEVTNLCSVNADGSLSGTTLYAVWNDDGSITVSLTLDDEGIDVDPDEIVLTGSDGTTYSKCFIKSEMRPGTYLFHSDDPGITPQGDGKLPDGKYTISVPGVVIPADKAVFEYSSTEATVLVYDYRTVTVKADDNVASATVDGEDSVVVLTGTKVHIKATVENGYHFDGWSWLGDDGKPEDLDAAAAEQDITADRTLELTAHAEGNVYTIVFSQNNDAYPNTEPATGSMEDQDIVFGESQGLFANKFNKKGYLFNGWNTKPDGSGDSYEDGATVQDLSSESGKRITLYAQWKARTYKITYKDPFGLCKTQVQTVNYNDPVNLLDADASGWTPSGHTLAGWEGDAAGSLYEPGKEVVNFCQVNEDGTLTGKNLYAVWADDGCIMVSVTLDDEGVDIDPDDIQLTDSNGTKYKGCFVKSDRAKGIYMYNMKIEEEPEVEDAVPDDELLPGEETVPDGETPDGGDAEPADNGSDNSGSGTGGSGDSGDAPAANEPAPAGDGQGDGGSAGNGAGDDEGASTETPSTEGQGGGKPAAGGQSDGDAPAATEPTAADTTAAGGASISSSIATAKAEDTISFSIAKPSEIKPAFGTRAAGDGVSGRLPDGEYYVQVLNYKSYGLADVRKKITYRGDQEYASWAYLASDTVKIEAGKHVASATLTDPDTGAETDQTVVPEGAKVDISATVSEEGYHFDSYAYSGIAPDMVMVAALQKITVRGAVTLYAQAAPNTYSIRFDANSGEGKMPDQLMTYDSESKLVAGRFTRTHYYFRGWNDKADGSGTAYKDKAAVSNLTSEDGGIVTLYAQWERKPVYSITFDLNGGTLNGKKGKIVVKADEGDVIKVLKAPTRKGYKFEYWEGSEYYPGDDFTVTEDHVLTAQWKKNKGGGDVPGGGGDDPGGDEIVEDTSTADSDGTQPPETGPEDIEDESTPLTTSENPWALLNLICAGLTTLGAVIALFRKKEEEDQDADEDGDEDEEAARARKAKIAKGAGVVAAAVSIITFILTEKMGGPMHLVDNWTILMAAYLGCQAVTAGMVKKYSKAEEYEDDGE